MKTIIKIFFTVFIIFQFPFSSFSQNPTYQLIAKNFQRRTPDSLTFEVYLLHTNPGTAVFTYAAGQYFFRFNNAIANGGTLSYKIISSGLPNGFVPVNPTVTGNELRLATNNISMINAPLISSTAPGTLVVKMSLKTTTTFNWTLPFGIRWRNSDDPPLFTKVTAFVGTTAVNITTGATHSIDSTVIGITQISNLIPDKFLLNQNYPNPFNPATIINYQLASNQFVSLKIYDVTGKETAILVNQKQTAGTYAVDFNGVGLPSGVYFYRLETGDFVDTKRMMLIK
ncbi:MAG: T9SS type A sorting domain-containing protein [bacterium]|nr:T9SS type A sorting domain-containing protein [bacterium]